MKKIILAAVAISLLAFSAETQAQSNKEKKEKKVTIKIISEEDGKKTVIDTTFNADDDKAIEAFLKAHDVDKPLPPVPPVPPASPKLPDGTTPPAPPSAPAPPDGDFSFHFDFDEKEFEDFHRNFDNQMEEVRDQIEEAKESIKQSLKEIKISKGDLKKIQEEINKELDKIDIKLEEDKHEKRVIIKRKTGDAGAEENTEWNTNAFVTGNGKIVKCIIKDGDKTNCRMIVTTADHKGEKIGEKFSTSEETVVEENKQDKDPEAATVEKKGALADNQLNPDDFKVFPNPNTGSFELQFNLKTRGKTTISVIDASGKEVFSESFTDFTGDYNRHIDLPSKGKGTYLLNVKQDDKWMHKKIVVK